MGQVINKLCCQHCGEENPNFFQFGSIDMINPQAKMMNPIMNQNYEWLPKLSIGFYIYCSKCKKHTVIIPNNYTHKEYDNNIPEHIIFSPIFQQPEYSATAYIMYNNGELDQVVTSNTGTIISLITRRVVQKDGSWREIDKNLYDLCLSKNFKEVSNEIESITSKPIDTSDGATSPAIYQQMEQHDGSTTTTNVSTLPKYEPTTNNGSIKK